MKEEATNFIWLFLLFLTSVVKTNPCALQPLFCAEAFFTGVVENESLIRI